MTDPAQQRLVALADGAEYAGKSTVTLRRWIRAGHITGYRVGPKLLHVDLDEVDDVLQPRPVKVATSHPEPKRPKDTRPPAAPQEPPTPTRERKDRKPKQAVA